MEQNYWTLIRSTQNGSYSDFVLKLENETYRSPQGRAVILERGDEGPIVREFKGIPGLKSLREILDSTNDTEVLRVIVLEDLRRQFIEVVGSRLRVPPSFFGDHWEDPNSAFSRRTLRHQDLGHRYMLKWQRFHRVNIAEDDVGINTYVMNSNVLRTVTRMPPYQNNSTELPGGGTIREEKLSFWSVGLHNNCWTGWFLFAHGATPFLANTSNSSDTC